VLAEIAAPKSTGGGGIVFEDDVCAWLLLCCLTGQSILGPSTGVPIRLDFQTRPDGWFLDDVLVTTLDGATLHRFATSIRSSPQFTASKAPEDFVECAWEQWFHRGSDVFERSTDFICLIMAPLSTAASNSIRGLTEKAVAGDAALLPARLDTPRWASESERKLFASFGCPKHLAPIDGELRTETARLLQRLRFIQHDFSIGFSSVNAGPATARAKSLVPVAQGTSSLATHAQSSGL
jgi:hypothetical protein